MAYRNLLVHVDHTKACQARIEAAVGLAQAHEAHLVALAPVVEPALPGYVAGSLPPEILEAQRDRAAEAALDALTRFREAARRAGISSEERHGASLDVDLRDLIALHARYSDLVILGQADPDDPPPGGEGLIEDVVMSAGRPALVIPYIGTERPIGERVMVAWDSGREAARAVADALPILEKAKLVAVMVVDAHKRDGAHGEEPGADIGLHLARHGIKAEVHHSEGADIGVGDAILSRLADEGSDLLVMGAYGHSRLRELILGGATRTILEQMTVPVLMSH